MRCGERQLDVERALRGVEDSGEILEELVD
jgi:hypothetical protein